MDGSHHINLGMTEQSGLARKLGRALLGGASALVVSEAGGAVLLASVGRLLGAGSARVVRVHPPLGLPEFLEQVASVSPAPDQSPLERAYELLTAPDPGYDRVVLLVEDAHVLPHPTLHYIEMALRAGPNLQVVLAGQPALLDKLALDGFSSLRQRLKVRMDLPPERAFTEPSSSELALPVAAPRTGRARRFDMLVGVLAVGAAALAAALYAQGPSNSAPPPAAAAALQPTPQPVPQPPRVVAEVEIVTALPAAPAGPPDPDPVEAAGPAPTFPAASSPPAAAPPPAAAAEALPVALPEPPAAHAAVPAPVRPAPRAVPVRAEHAAPSQPSLTQNDRRCRDIVLRAQLGDAPDNADQTFLRNGCR